MPLRLRVIRPLDGFAILICSLLIATPGATQETVHGERIVIDYVAPAHARHRRPHDVLKSSQVLERVRDVLAPVRWPRTLRLELRECDGELNAWYENAVVTVCYELLDEMWRRANVSRRPSGISREDAFIGPLVDVFLHEVSHALFDLFKLPLLGQEEDAADQLAAYFVLQFPKERKRRLVLGGAYAHASELKVRRVQDLYRRRLQLGSHASFADEHGTTAQRLYNLLCIAYGSDRVLFADVVEKGFLPMGRAEICKQEYQQVDFAFRTLVGPHLDR